MNLGKMILCILGGLFVFWAFSRIAKLQRELHLSKLLISKLLPLLAFEGPQDEEPPDNPRFLIE
jgi:hypothetical protein